MQPCGKGHQGNLCDWRCILIGVSATQQLNFYRSNSNMHSRGKLDLNGLLAKYEVGGSPSHTQYQYFQEVKEQEVHYPHRTQQKENDIVPQLHTQLLRGNFQMSKSECQQFLLTVRGEIKNQQKGLTFCTENAMRHLHQKFARDHERIRKEVLELLDRAFRDNERAIKEEIARQHQTEPAEFTDVHRKMYSIDEEITTMLNKLKSADYRRGIADVVVRDFVTEMEQLRSSIKSSTENYLASLGEVEPDRERIECIKRDLTGLFYLNKKTAALVGNTIFSVFNEKPMNHTEAPRQQSQQMPVPLNSGGSQKGRKSFFNFGE